MKIISEIPEYLVNEIRLLVGKGKYSSREAFILTAVENQLALEEKPDIRAEKAEEASADVVQEEAPRRFLELKLDEEKEIQAIAPPSFEELNLFQVANEKELWIWGQINKILPVKFLLRLLMNQIPTGQKYVNLGEFEKKARALGRNFGLALQRQDELANRRRDERLSIAFPIGRNEDKAGSRFSYQFIGSIRKSDGLIHGALPRLKFANILKDDSKLLIGITDSGLTFARLQNPIIDGLLFKNALSEEETKFYLSHVSKKIPGEENAFTLILSLIEKGTNTPESIKKAMKQNVPSTWTNNVLGTQRSGAISRLFELGLVKKTRDGVTVKYEITDRGRGYLHQQI